MNPCGVHFPGIYAPWFVVVQAWFALFMRTCSFPIQMFPGFEKSRTMLCFLRDGVPKIVS